MKVQKVIVLLLLVIGLMVGVLEMAEAAAAPVAGRFKKVMIVIFENTDYVKAIREPAFANFAQQGGLLTQYYAITHPSQSNYFALVGGDPFVRTNNSVDLNVSSLADLLEAKGLTWKTYAEGFPGNCFLGSTRGRYVRKHNPFISFVSIQNNSERCARIVSAQQLETDIQNDEMPNFSLYVPDMDNSGHDTGVGYAARWFEQRFGPLRKNPAFMNDMLLIVTFDEGSRMGTNRVYTVLYGAGVKAGSSSDKVYDHYSLLRTLEEGWSLGTLGRNDQRASLIDDLWLEERPGPMVKR